MSTFLLDDMAAYIQTQSGGFWTEATNLFAGAMPDTPDPVTALFEYSGLAPDYVMGGTNSLPAIAHPNLQVVVRDPSYLSSRSAIEQITRELELIVNQTVNGTYYFRVARKQDPFFLHRDAVKNRTYWACNFEVDRQPS